MEAEENIICSVCDKPIKKGQTYVEIYGEPVCNTCFDTMQTPPKKEKTTS